MSSWRAPFHWRLPVPTTIGIICALFYLSVALWFFVCSPSVSPHVSPTTLSAGTAEICASAPPATVVGQPDTSVAAVAKAAAAEAAAYWRPEALRVLVVIGTRAEAIRCASVIWRLRELAPTVDVKTLLLPAANHHDDLVLQYLDALYLDHIDVDLSTFSRTAGTSIVQSIATSLVQLQTAFSELKPHIILAEGDSTTVLATSMAALLCGVPLGHIEAGLRSGDLMSPFPEELNRRVADVATSLYFAPTQLAALLLEHEGIDRSRIFVSGSTIADAVRAIAAGPTPPALWTVLRDPLWQSAPSSSGELDHSSTDPQQPVLVLVTSHHRESYLNGGMSNITLAIWELALRFPEVHFAWSVHPNPALRDTILKRTMPADFRTTLPNLQILERLSYDVVVHLLKRSYLIVTDSAELQEEGAALGVPTVLLHTAAHTVTGRNEAVLAGISVVIGTDMAAINHTVSTLLLQPELIQYMKSAATTAAELHSRDVNASHKIVDAILGSTIALKHSTKSAAAGDALNRSQLQPVTLRNMSPLSPTASGLLLQQLMRHNIHRKQLAALDLPPNVGPSSWLQFALPARAAAAVSAAAAPGAMPTAAAAESALHNSEQHSAVWSDINRLRWQCEMGLLGDSAPAMAAYERELTRDPQDRSLTVVLAVWRRNYFPEQLDAIEASSIPVTQVLVWQNGPHVDVRAEVDARNAKHGKQWVLLVQAHNGNWKYHARLALGLLVNTTYIAFIDDDVVVGAEWLEMSIDAVNEHYAVAGSNGRLVSEFFQEQDQAPVQQIGSKFTTTTPDTFVDFLIHAWTLRTAWVRLLWSERIPTWDTAEDIDMCAVLALRCGIRSVVVGHRERGEGCRRCPERKSYGYDQFASTTFANRPARRFHMAYWMDRGWRIIGGRQALHWRVPDLNTTLEWRPPTFYEPPTGYLILNGGTASAEEK